MASVAEDLKQVDQKNGKKVEDVGQIPQWKLMVRRFSKSKLSVGALIVLIIMYILVKHACASGFAWLRWFVRQ